MEETFLSFQATKHNVDTKTIPTGKMGVLSLLTSSRKYFRTLVANLNEFPRFMHFYIAWFSEKGKLSA